MRPTVLERIVPQLRRHEGEHLTAYLCPSGKVTIGVGHNMEANPVPGLPAVVGTRINADQSRRLLIADLMAFDREMLEALPWVSSLDDARYGVLLNMAFNLGVLRLCEFKNTLRAVQDARWDDAANGMLASKWAKQVKGRAIELAQQMRIGSWQ